nr:uncharacterized protein LOC113699791 [Coffea arabica]
MQDKEYPFLDSDVSGMFDDLLSINLITLPEMKRPDESRNTDDPNYSCVAISDEKSRVPTSNEEVNVTSITFTSEDLLLGSTPHNRPLFVTGYANEQKVNRILIDGGSTVNILPLKTLKELGIPVDELSNSRLMIQGFNQGGQRALESLNLEIVIDDMSSRASLYVIDAKTTYNEQSPAIQHETLKGLTLPVVHLDTKKASFPPLKRSNLLSKESEAEQDTTPESRTKDGFDPIAHKLLAKAGYDLKEFAVLNVPSRQSTSDMIHGLNRTQKMLKEKGYAVENLKFGLGYSSPAPIRININRASSQYIIVEDESSQITEEEEDAEDTPTELEEGVKATVDDVKEINFGTSEDSRPIYVSALLNPDEEKAYIELLREYQDIFVWTYKEMPGLDPKVAVHHLAVKKGVRPVKQAQRRDLNNACPKDDFPLPIIELLIDATAGHEILSFMDGSSGYNQIRLVPEDEELTAFRTPKGIYCYKIMPFGLKNVGATYQRAMQSIFDDMLHKNIECYVDDLVVKLKKRSNHLEDLRQVFYQLRRYQLKINPLKCAFGVTSEKFLGFVVRHRGIEIDQAKIDAILRMSESRDIHELKSLQGRLAYLRRFISNLTGRCQPFSRLMKKNVPFQWDEACSNAFNSIKSYLMKAPVLTAPIHGKPLLLYIAAQERSVGVLLAQENNEGKEVALYYLSRMMTPNELNYSLIEKLCLAFIFAI